MNKSLFILLIVTACIHGEAQLLGKKDAIVYAMDVNSENHLLAASLGDNIVEIWNYESKSLSNSFTLSSPCTSLAFVGSTYFAIAQSDGTIDIFNLVDYGKVSSFNVGENPVIILLSPDQKKLMAADSKGNVFSSNEVGPNLSFRKLFTSENPISGMEALPTKEVILTAHNKKDISIWSMQTGNLIQTQVPGDRQIFLVKSDSTETQIVTTEGANKVGYYFFEKTKSLNQINSTGYNGWPTAIDIKKGVVAVGTSHGIIQISAAGISYKTRMPYIINHIIVLKEYFPNILLAVGTHGGGIRILPVTAMKMVTN